MKVLHQKVFLGKALTGASLLAAAVLFWFAPAGAGDLAGRLIFMEGQVAMRRGETGP